MTFKEKHLLPLMLSSVLTLSCAEDKSDFQHNTGNAIGLLDKRPLKSEDKYSSPVVLQQVNVPIYKNNGQRATDYYMLTRGLKTSSYSSPQSYEDMPVKGAYFNGSQKLTYVKADENNAIYTEDGFSGLFIDNNKRVVVVADANVERFTSSLTQAGHRNTNNDYRRSSSPDAIEYNEEKRLIPADSILSDSIRTIKLTRLKNDSITTDTLLTKHMVDTLQNSRHK